eukprot:158309-Rhodomonas_salina.2
MPRNTAAAMTRTGMGVRWRWNRTGKRGMRSKLQALWSWKDGTSLIRVETQSGVRSGGTLQTMVGPNSEPCAVGTDSCGSCR